MTPTPEEPPTGGPDDDDAASGGWIDPEDRLWRHPSEVARRGHRGARATLAGAAKDSPPDEAHDPRRRDGRRSAAVAWTVILLSVRDSPPPGHPAISDAIDRRPAHHAGRKDHRRPRRVADAAGHAMVQLQAETSHGTVHLVGVAVAEGGLVATAGADLSGLRSLSMVGARRALMPATLVAVDPKSDVALVDVPDDLPVAPFTDDVSLADGNPDLTLTVASAPRPARAWCTVRRDR